MKKLIKSLMVVMMLVIAAVAFAAETITEIGTGLPGQFQGTQGKLMARRAAITDCYRNLAAAVQGVQVSSETTVAGLMVSNDTVITKVNGIIRGATIIEEKANDDGSYVVKMELPLFGNNSIAAAVLPELKGSKLPEQPMEVVAANTVLPKAEFKTAKGSIYTGVILDASGMGLETTMAPQIIDTNGRVIYGIDNISIDAAVKHGLAEYSRDLQAAAGGSTRAGKNALVVKAKAVKGGSNSVNPVNVVVSPEDADRILLAFSNNDSIAIFGKIAIVR